MELMQRKRMNSLLEVEDNPKRSISKRPVEKWSHSNNRKGWMLNVVWFWCHLSKMRCPALNKRKEKHNKLEEDR